MVVDLKILQKFTCSYTRATRVCRNSFMQTHTHRELYVTVLVTYTPLSLSGSVSHPLSHWRAIQFKFKSFCPSLIPQQLTHSYLLSSLFLSAAKRVWDDSEQEATPNTMLIRLEGRPPAITLDLRSSSPLISSFSPSVQPQDFPPPTFPSLHLSLCLPTPNLTPSSSITPSAFFWFTNLRREDEKEEKESKEKDVDRKD